MLTWHGSRVGLEINDATCAGGALFFLDPTLVGIEPRVLATERGLAIWRRRGRCRRRRLLPPVHAVEGLDGESLQVGRRCPIGSSRWTTSRRFTARAAGRRRRGGYHGVRRTLEGDITHALKLR